MNIMSEQEHILQLFKDGDRAIVAADVAELTRIYAGDYIQYDENGRSFSKQDVLDNAKSGAIRYVSMTSTGRSIRVLSGDIAIVHGSEEDEIEQDGRRFTARYIYMDVVVKRGGRWQIVASQLAKPI
jgi:ketosteroid isomerase-like protein